MSIKIIYNMEKDLYFAYIDPKKSPARVILAIGDTFHETIAKAWHRFIVRKQHEKYHKK